MNRNAIGVVLCVLVFIAGERRVFAQSWDGAYVGGFIGAGLQANDRSETVRFDTNLDGGFSDTVRTVAGVDAFSPGFCGGLANTTTPSGGCADDDMRRIDFGGRAGYDWQMGRLVIGGLGDFSRTRGGDSVSAFSTTPAFYAFTRELESVTAVRGRAGIGFDRLLLYGTGGVAWARVAQSFTTSNRVNTFVAVAQDGDSTIVNAIGYQAGAGFEVSLGRRWSTIGEYLFTSIDDRTTSTIRSQGPAPATNPFILVNAQGTDLRREDRLDLGNVRVSLAYRF
jgi:outer membrane immunogenic protein